MRLSPPARARHGPRSRRDWQGPQMATVPQRGWSRGGGRAPSRGSCPGALGVRASPLEGRTSEAPLEPARGGGRGRGDSGREEGARGRPGESRLRRGPMLQGGGGPRMEAGGEGVSRGDSGSCPRRPGGTRRGPQRSPRAPAQPAEAKKANPGRDIGHLGARATAAGKRWGGPCLRAPGCLGPPVPGKRRQETPRGSRGRGNLGSFRKDRLDEQVLGLPVVGRPQQRRFLEVQMTGCRRSCRVLLSRGGLFLSLEKSQESFKKVTLHRFHLLTQHLQCVRVLLGAGHTEMNKTDQSDTVCDLTGIHGL